MHRNTSTYFRLNENKNNLFINLLMQLLKNKSIFLTQIVLFINLLLNGDVVSFLPLFFMLSVGITSNPFPSKTFWKFLLLYFFFLITIKSVY